MNKIRRRRQIKIFKNIALRPALEVEDWVIYPALNISPNTEEGRRPGKATFLIPHPCERGRPIASLCHYILNTQSHNLVIDVSALETPKLSWIIRVLAGITSCSSLRARLRRRPTENPQVRGDIKNKTCNELFNYSSIQLFNYNTAVGCIAMHQNTAGGKLCCQ